MDIFNKDIYLSKNLIEKNNINYIENLAKIRNHNKIFINKKMILNKEYFDNLFLAMDPNIKLDDEQREAIIKDEDYNLVIAGAGSGKTTTMMAKIKYLIDIQKVKEEEILAISFAKKNTEELQDKLKEKFGINIEVTTFHKLGLNIILKNDKKRFSIIEDSKKYNFFYELF